MCSSLYVSKLTLTLSRVHCRRYRKLIPPELWGSVDGARLLKAAKSPEVVSVLQEKQLVSIHRAVLCSAVSGWLSLTKVVASGRTKLLIWELALRAVQSQ